MYALHTFRFPRVRLLAALIAASFSCFALAEQTNLADEPVAAANKVPPTAMFTADDSDSMKRYYAPESIYNGPRQPDKWSSFQVYKDEEDMKNKNENDPDVSKKVFFFWGHGIEMIGGISTSVERVLPEFLNYKYNRLAYDPFIDYLPPVNEKGESLPEMNSANTDGWTKVVWGGNKPEYQIKSWGRPMLVDLTAMGFPDTTIPNHDNPDEYNFRPSSPFFFSGDKFTPISFANPSLNPERFDHVEKARDGTILRQKSRSREEEMINYANWAAYYRNRIGAIKSAASHAFYSIVCDPQVNKNCDPARVPRIGFTTITREGYSNPDNPSNEESESKGRVPQRLDPEYFNDATYRKAFFDSLFALQAVHRTPLRETAYQVGMRFEKNENKKYILGSCQRNYHIMFTDGEWNQIYYPSIANLEGIVGDQDSTLTADLPEEVTVYNSKLKDADASWPSPIANGPNQDKKMTTLADIALYFWMRDLNTSADLGKNNVFTTADDPARWQHLNFISMGFGVEGKISTAKGEKAVNEAELKAGTQSWPNAIVYPPEDKDESDPRHVDDLWHAAFNGFGKYVTSQSPSEFRTELHSILLEIMNIGGSRTGVAVTMPNMNVLNFEKFAYVPLFTGGWGGDLVKRKLKDDAMDESVVDDKTSKVVMTASEQLDKLLTPDTANPQPWLTRRNIYTQKKGNAIEFTWEKLNGNLSATEMEDAFGKAPTGSTLTDQEIQTRMIAYLRGDRRNEGSDAGQFRKRTRGTLGDIVNAQPVVVTTPLCYQFEADGDVRCEYSHDDYEGFYEQYKDRKTMVYAAANDGMVHAFDGDLNEKWAYIPSDILRSRDKNGLINLANRLGDSEHPFKHLFYVDATPRTLDVQFEGSSGSNWHSVLVGGLGKGGTSYYALDVTEAGTFKFLWEFTDPNMGYSFGRPLLAMTRASAWKTTNDKAKWVAILPSGYNNGTGENSAKDSGDGKGRLFFIDVQTGHQLGSIATTEGTASSPINIVHIAGFTETAAKQIITAVYAGDERGGFWRFDLEDTDHSKWTATKIGKLVDNNGDPQYVTTEPFVLMANGKRYIGVGTGGFRNAKDLTSAQIDNTFYVFRDGNGKSVNKSLTMPIERAQMLAVDWQETGPADGANSEPAVDYGWYSDLPPLYHVNLNPKGKGNIISYAANKYVPLPPSSGKAGYLDQENACATALFEAYIFARDAGTAKSVLREWDGSKDGKLVANLRIPDGLVYFDLVQKKGETDKFSFIGDGGAEDPNATNSVLNGAGFAAPQTANNAPMRVNLRYINPGTHQ